MEWEDHGGQAEEIMLLYIDFKRELPSKGNIGIEWKSLNAI